MMKAFLLLTLFFVTTTISALASEDSRPNVLLLMPDQWRWDWDGLTHKNVGEAPPLHLPHIERLRALGTTFPRGAVVPAPVCAPSRASSTRQAWSTPRPLRGPPDACPQGKM